MKSTKYSEKVLEHFRNPQNVGTLSGENVALGRVGNPTCGDIMEMYIKVEDNIIKDIKFQTFGCGSAVATSSMTTLMVKGMTLDEALKVTRKDVAEELDGLPPIKMHCSNLAADALHEAIKNYKAGILVEQPESIEKPIENKSILGELEYLGKGVYYSITNKDYFKDQRVLIRYNGDESIRAALELTKITNRVIISTSSTKIHTDDKELKTQLRNSNVKILTEAKILAVMGDDEVEKVRMLDLDEDSEYDIFVDRLVLLNTVSIPPVCENV